MTDDQLLRYSRHILLDDIGIEGQEKLLAARALIIGAGGLGSPVALYLGSAGVGHITIVDNDTVDATNLQRQIAHNLANVGTNKAQSARKSIAAINPDPQVSCIEQRADAALLSELVSKADVVIDCCDNFATRHAVNAACVQRGVPLVSGAAIRFDGQISVYDMRRNTAGARTAPSELPGNLGDRSAPECPCYACVFPPDSTIEETACATMGVFAPLVGIIGSMQAAEALKLLTGVGSSLAGRLQMLDGRSMEWSEVRLPRNPACAVCGV